MSEAIWKTISRVPDSVSAEIDITTEAGQIIRLNSIYKESDSPEFFLVFPPKRLPEEIDRDKLCPVSIKSNQSAITLLAKIVSIKGDRTLELLAQDTVKPESLREYFRVDTKVNITANYTPDSIDGEKRSWTLKGQTLDISGSGTLTLMAGPPQTFHKIDLQLDLDNGKNIVNCTAHVVRTKRLRRDKYQVAFHFDTLKPNHRDAIISFCLQEQRNRLRDKIQTLD